MPASACGKAKVKRGSQEVFALEIDFHDGMSPTETILVRRPHAIVGNSDFAHVVVEGSNGNLCELRVSRGLGREFRCQPLKKPGETQTRVPFVPGVYSGEAELDLGGVIARIVSLDMDLQLAPEESVESAEARVFRLAMGRKTPIFPAVAVLGKSQLFMSFPPDEKLLIGRSRNCGLRLDAADVSSEHARMGLDGENFWIEDLRSTNGTYVGSERVRGRRVVQPGEPVLIGSEILIAGVRTAEDLARLSARPDVRDKSSEEQGFPCVIASSEFIQPTQLILPKGQKMTIGRDPASDIWIPAGHISRVHAELRLNESGLVEITDLSSNGIYVRGDRLPRRQATPLPKELSVIDLRRGIRLGICFNREDEVVFSKIASSRDKSGETVSEINTAIDDSTKQIERTSRQDTRETAAPSRATTTIRTISDPLDKREDETLGVSASVHGTVQIPAGQDSPDEEESSGRLFEDESESSSGERVAERRDTRKATLINGKIPSIAAAANGAYSSDDFDDFEHDDLAEEKQKATSRFSWSRWKKWILSLVALLGVLFFGIVVGKVLDAQKASQQPNGNEVDVFEDAP